MDGMPCGRHINGIMAFKKGNDALKDAVEAALDQVKASGKLGEIAVKYFGTEDVLAE